MSNLGDNLSLRNLNGHQVFVRDCQETVLAFIFTARGLPDGKDLVVIGGTARLAQINLGDPTTRLHVEHIYLKNINSLLVGNPFKAQQLTLGHGYCKVTVKVFIEMMQV